MRTANPALNARVFQGYAIPADASEVMTLQGTVNRTVGLLALVLVGALYVWKKFYAAPVEVADAVVGPWVWGGLIGGLITGLVIIRKKTWAPAAAPLYAVLEGLFLGGLSATLEARFPGIVVQAVALTLGTLLALLMAYKSGLIKATANFKLGVSAATGGIIFLYLISTVMRLFGMEIGFLHSSSALSIGLSFFIVIVAALNLVLDFDFIEQGAAQGAPKYMEWYAAFGLLVTLVWLYIEILRLLSKLRAR